MFIFERAEQGVYKDYFDKYKSHVQLCYYKDKSQWKTCQIWITKRTKRLRILMVQMAHRTVQMDILCNIHNEMWTLPWFVACDVYKCTTQSARNNYQQTNLSHHF